MSLSSVFGSPLPFLCYDLLAALAVASTVVVAVSVAVESLNDLKIQLWICYKVHVVQNSQKSLYPTNILEPNFLTIIFMGQFLFLILSYQAFIKG